MLNSRRKGKVGELQFCEMLRQHGVAARRGCQYEGGPGSPDVVTDLPVHFEVKRVEAFNAYQSLAQAMQDCGSKMPVVAHRRNNADWIAVLRMTDFLALLQNSAQQKSESG